MGMMRKPEWLRVRLSGGKDFSLVRRTLEELSLATVCQEARCPNIGECFGRRSATFMILGRVCTRRCLFCAVGSGVPEVVDRKEPMRVAEAVKRLGLRYVVVTSVTRDDLKDGGAKQFAQTVAAIREKSPECVVEVLIPDFQGKKDDIDEVIAAKPDVIGHNLETTRRLAKLFRDERADYDRSLALLRYVKEVSGIRTKSGIMVGLGEGLEEALETLRDLRESGVDMVVIGQYLPPRTSAPPVKRFYTEEEFKVLRDCGRALGFQTLLFAPLARSSYRAEELYAPSPEIIDDDRYLVIIKAN